MISKLFGNVAMVAISLVVLSGCGSSQPAPAQQNSAQQEANTMPKFEVGKTTKDDVIAVLGQPTGQAMNSKGEETIYYRNTHITGKAWIPFYYGSDRVRTKMMQYTFKNNILVSTSSASNHY